MQTQKIDLGHAEVSPPEPLVAGAFVTLRYTYTAGFPIDDTGCIKVVFRFASDCGQPQFNDPAGANYCLVSTTGDCRIEARFDPKGHTRPWDRAIYLKVMGGFLDAGRQVVVVFGDRSAGSPGWQAQTFCEDSFEFKTLVDPIATYEFKELPVSPTVRIVPGTPAKAVCINPSQIPAGQAFDYWLKLEDAWGNPTAPPRPIGHPGFAKPGMQRLTATDPATGLTATGNPLLVLPPDKPAAFRHCWADFHGQSEETIGSNSIADYFRFARDYALLDICAHQGNDFQITDEFWQTVNDTCASFNAPGRFVTFPGFEWSGNTPLGGDRNIYFAAEGGSICHSCTDLLPEKVTRHPVSQTADQLFAELRRLPGPRPFGFSHVGGRYADMRLHDPEIELAVEIHSAWGTFEWLLDDALKHGAKVGICANSDGHKGRPGASYPGASKFGSYGGLTCVLAASLDRQAVLEALLARRFYATTGNRALADLRLELPDGRLLGMGESASLPAGSRPKVRISLAGSGPIEAVDICRPGLPPVTRRPAAKATGRRCKLAWSGAEVRGRARICNWDGCLLLAGTTITGFSPVNFFNPSQPLRQTSGRRLEWRSITTGGASGVILELRTPGRGQLRVQTLQGNAVFDLANLGPEPEFRDFGGLEKRLTLSRLPDTPGPADFAFEVELPPLAAGSHPVWLRMQQEDGHVLWTSPIFLSAVAANPSPA